MPPSKPKDPRPSDNARTANASIRTSEVLDVAAELFAERGFRGTNLEDVASRMQVTRQALYYYYPRKHSMLLALLDRSMSRLEERSRQVLEQQPDDLLYELLRGHCEVVAANISLVTVLLVENAEVKRTMESGLDQRRRAYKKLFVDAFEAGVRSGRLIPSPHPGITVNILLGALNSLWRWYDAGGQLAPDRMAELVVDQLYCGLLQPEHRLGRVDVPRPSVLGSGAAR